jgi:hypothetical protein
MPYFDRKPCNDIKCLEEDLLPIEQAPFVIRGWEPPPLDSMPWGETYLSIHFGTKDEYDHLVRVIRAGIATGSLHLVSLRVDDQDVESISLRELLPYLRRQGIHVRPELAELAKARGILPRTQGIVVDAEIRDLLQEDEAQIREQESAHHRETADHHTKPVSLSFIARAFMIKKEEDENWKWWNKRTRNAKRYGLAECRGQRGRGKRESTWHPDLIACWLVDRKKISGLSGKQAATLLRKRFPACEETAIRLERIDD